jgi:DnaJ-class molecular chaperone
MRLSEAYELLELHEDCTLEQLTERWRDLRSKHHPDRGGDADTFIQLREAHRKIEQELTKPKPCPDCNGSGKQEKSRGWNTITMRCASCGGTGKTGGAEDDE